MKALLALFSGHICWIYMRDDHQPRLTSSVVDNYGLFLADSDGVVEYDMPSLEHNEVGKINPPNSIYGKFCLSFLGSVFFLQMMKNKPALAAKFRLIFLLLPAVHRQVRVSNPGSGGHGGP